MNQVSTATRPVKSVSLRLLVEPDPWFKVFNRNFRELFRSEPQWHGTSSPGRFWPDVFVSSRWPKWGLLESGFYHLIVLTVLWATSHFAVIQAQRIQPLRFHRSDVVTYSASEYLPPLNTMSGSRAARRGDPKYAKQEIISVPHEADNSRQTIVTPPIIKLKQDVPLPNIVAWTQTPLAVPVAATARSASEMKVPELPTSVVAPAPDANLLVSARNAEPLQTAVIEPPPSVQAESIRKVGDISIGHSDVIAPAPRLALGEQRPVGARGEIAGIGTPSVVAPPPVVAGAGSRGGGELIALNAEPAPTLPSQLPVGNRRGTFAATPEGRASGSGTPAMSGGGSETGHGSSASAGSVPRGLYVGKGSTASAIAGHGTGPFATAASGLMASSAPPRVSSKPAQGAEPVPPELTLPVERKVFGERKFYAMTQNMPNLNSAGGSWVIRFAELKQSVAPGTLIPPIAVRKVDPAYPVELMKNNVAGVVTLYAVIHSDGHVSTVRVLEGADERLNEFASEALTRWQFQPAVKDGSPIAVEAVIRVPFKPRKSAF